ncbi:Cd2+/Zn2+-exporting ATPase [Haloplanus vescus]|uniref:P-type Cu(+) transporter n=1 Tax=Haloplanus vescus TaxID=555874 RepID=A0A1H3X8Z7_9EURY|nr:heavy metal translocating P-type ATPase [Haloplanus vescus]SDZ95866.1 Cd2+/Zn2+-exporting ATPase [Haloplanus vescus]
MTGHDGDEDGAERDEEAAPATATDGARYRASVPEMDCASCASKVERSVREAAGAESVDTRPATGTLVVEYDPDATTEAAIRERVEAAGYEVAETTTETFAVPSMDCSSCAGTVESALSRVEGVLDYDARPASGRVVVTYAPERATRGEVVAGIENAGYDVVESEDESPSAWRSRRALKTGVGAVLLLAGVAVEYLGGAPPVVASVLGHQFTLDWVLYVLAAAAAGQTIVRNGWYSARARSLDIDFLMSAGVLGAIAVDLPFEAATLAVLFSVSELLERYSMDRARTSMSELMDLSPDTATVRRDGEEGTVPVEDVAVGDVVLVRPGERIPVDGVVREGTSAVDESPITGESVPVDVSEGDEVYAGSIVEEGYLEVETTTPAAESTLAKVIDLVADAERDKSERERFIDRFADYYTPAVVALAVATTLGPPLVLGAPFETWFTRGLTLLVVACPCAFVISTPVSVVSGITSAARNGVLIKGGDRLEAMGDVTSVALDKTGTITTGELGVTDVVALNGQSEDDVLRCAAALERRSEHPIAAAIVERATDRGVDGRDVSDFQSITGQGVRADLDGVTHYAGKPALFADLGVDLEHAHVKTDGGLAVGEVDPMDCEHGSYLDLVNDVVPRLQGEGKTVVLVGRDDGDGVELEGVVAVADTVRPEAERTVARLRELGIERIAMVTGDNERTAHAIAEQVGIDEVYADLLPEEKVAVVREMTADAEASEESRLPWNRTGGGVAMVGDGVNDAPALATATVGVAMGAAGTDTAIETADVALMGDDLTRLPYLVALARRANRVIETNVWSSLAVKAALAAAAPFGLVSVVHAVVIGDMGMSLAVTGNAMRLAGIDPEE